MGGAIFLNLVSGCKKIKSPPTNAASPSMKLSAIPSLRTKAYNIEIGYLDDNYPSNMMHIVYALLYYLS